MFGFRVGFSGTADRMALFPVLTNTGKISRDGHISATGCPIDLLFRFKIYTFLADRTTNGRAIVTLLRLSSVVCRRRM